MQPRAPHFLWFTYEPLLTIFFGLLPDVLHFSAGKNEVCSASTVSICLLHCANEGVLGYPARQNFPHQLYLRDFMYWRNSTLSWHLAQCLSGLVHLCGPWLDGWRTDKSACPWLLGSTEEVWKGLRPVCGVMAVRERVWPCFLNGER